MTQEESLTALVAAMGADHGRQDSSYPVAYGYLKATVQELATVQEFLDGHLSSAELDAGLTRTERALLTYRAELQRRRDSHPAIR
jgi:hypothetical protein